MLEEPIPEKECGH